MNKEYAGNSTGSYLKAGFIVAAAVILILELFYISLNFDAAILKRHTDLRWWQVPFGNLGQVARIAVLALCIFAFLSKARLIGYWQSLLIHYSLKRAVAVLPLQLIAYLALIYLTNNIFQAPKAAPSTSPLLYSLWLLSALVTLGTWIMSQTGSALLRDFLRHEWKSLLVATVTSVIIWWIAMLSQSMWRVWGTEYLVDGTFAIASLLLSGYGQELIYSDPTRYQLGIGDFIVRIAPECSGYEGIGLILAFTTLYLTVYRKDMRFPLALLLFPLGVITIWILNSVRIAALVVIGYHWSPDIAVGGFHSQAGWITFILTSFGILWIANSSSLFTKAPAQATTAPSSRQSINLPIATLLPLVAMLALTLLSNAFSSGFDWLYPVRVIVVALIIIRVWKILDLRPYKPRWEALFAGFTVTGIWILLLGSDAEANTVFQSGLTELSTLGAALWLGFRIIGTTVTVPIAEELAFRAYLLCKLNRSEVTCRGQLHGTYVWGAVIVSSIAFGALHGAWIAGTIAGLAYGWVRLRTGHVGDAILAHALTNGTLVVYASATGEWALL